MSRLAMVVNEMEFARAYSLQLIESVHEADWFRMPPAGVTHVGWQVGHLAVAKYSLTLRRMRGEQPADEQLVSAEFRGLFGIGSEPTPDAAKYPAPAEIRAVFDRVHEAGLATAKGLSDEGLDQPAIGGAHPVFKTKLGALLWCARHEMLHAGQIGLLRRQLGQAPLR